MQFDLAHALVTALIVFAVLWWFRKAGWAEGNRPDWRQIGVIAVAVFVLNLLWPV